MMGPTTRRFFGFAGSVAVHAAILALLLSPATLSVKPHAELVNVEFVDHPTSPVESKIEAPIEEPVKIPVQKEEPKEKFVKVKPKPAQKIPAKKAPKISAPLEPAPVMPEPVEKAISENEESASSESSEENVAAAEPETESPTPSEESDEAPLNVVPERQDIQAAEDAEEPAGPPAKPAPILPPGPATGSTGKMIDEALLEPMPGNMRPQYSYMARLQKMQGTVVIKAFVRQDGKMNAPVLERSSGHGHLDDLALKAFSQWRWVPGPSGWLRKEFVFRIADTDKSNKVSQF